MTLGWAPAIFNVSPLRLVDACFADHATRGEPPALPALPADRLGITVYSFAVQR